MPQENNWKNALGIDVRGNTVAVGFRNPQSGSVEVISAYTLPEGWDRKTLCSDMEMLERVLLSLDEDVRMNGIERPGYVLCIPDDFPVRERIRVQEMADRAGICLIRMMEESSAAAMHICDSYAFHASFLVVNVDGDQIVCSLFQYMDGILEILEKSISRMIRGMEHAVSSCIRQFSGLAFCRGEGAEGNGFAAPALVLEMGSPEQSHRIKAFLNHLFSGMAHGNQIRYLIGDRGNLFFRGTVVYAAELKEGSRNILFLDTLLPHKMYLQVNNRIMGLERDRVIPLTSDLSGLLENEEEALVTLLEENADGMLEPAASGRMPQGEPGEDHMPGLRIDREKRFMLALGEKMEFMHAQLLETPERSEEENISREILKFLEIADSLEYGMQGIQDPNDAHLAGLRNIFRKMTDLFAAYGIERYGEVGDTFDPAIHNAVVHITDIDLPENSIRQVVQSGYRNEKRILRYASVVVAN